MRVFGIDPGSQRTGFGCVESDGRRHRLVICGAIRLRTADAFPTRLSAIYRELTIYLRDTRPEVVAIETLFHANNVRSALLLGHARGVAMLAAVEAGIPVVEYTPAEVKRAVVGYGRAEKPQVQQMIKLLLGLAKVPSPHDAADALAVAICHLHAGFGKRGQSPFLESAVGETAEKKEGSVTFSSAGAKSSWRKYKPATRPA